MTPKPTFRLGVGRPQRVPDRRLIDALPLTTAEAAALLEVDRSTAWYRLKALAAEGTVVESTGYNDRPGKTFAWWHPAA